MRRGEWREQLEREIAATRLVVVRCARCGFAVELPIEPARAAFAGHSCASREPAARA